MWKTSEYDQIKWVCEKQVSMTRFSEHVKSKWVWPDIVCEKQVSMTRFSEYVKSKWVWPDLVGMSKASEYDQI